MAKAATSRSKGGTKAKSKSKAAPRSKAPPRHPAGFRKRTFDINGVETAVYVGGQGTEPVVFFHGAGTATGWGFAAPWARKYKVYLPHHPGWGESADGAFDSVQDFLFHYLELFDRLKLDRINLVGLSMGGWIASTFAAQNPHRIKKLVLVAPAGLQVPAHPNQDIFKLKPEEFPAYLAHDLSAFLKFLPPPDSPEMLEFQVAAYRETSSFARIAWERAYAYDLPKWLGRITAPTLLLYGDKDRIVPWRQGREWVKLIPKARLKTIKNAGHLVLDEKPEAAREIAKFIG